MLYETAREFIGDALPSGADADVAEHGKVVFDLYSGTGTIAQMLAPVAKKGDRRGDHSGGGQKLRRRMQG